MNELLKKLAKNAGFSPFDSQSEIVEKFAELIVKECAELVDNDDSSYPYDSFGHKLKQHFGVK